MTQIQRLGRSGDQDTRMRQILAELELCSTVPAPGYQPRSSSGKAGSREPQGEHGPMAGLRAAYDAAHTDDAREQVIDRAERTLLAIRGGETVRTQRPEGETAQARERRMVQARLEGWPPRDVANEFHCTDSVVRKVRLAHGRDPETGRMLPDSLAARRALTRPENRPERAQRLRASGSSERQIAEAMGVQRTQVRRWLGTDSAKRKAA